jgi:heme exporter protein A
MVDVRNLVKTFGPLVALDGVDLSVAPGEFVILVGPNGAGKTTLLRIIATLARPTSGKVQIAGFDAVRAGPEVRRRIGFLSHRTLLYDDLTAEQNLRFYSRMYDVADGSARVEAILERVGLASRRNDLVRTFSRGMQQRLSVARALLHRPDLLLLDEPYSGLDVLAAESLTALLSELATDGRTVLLTTHDLARAADLGCRVVVLMHGQVVRDLPPAELNATALRAAYAGG